VSLQAIEPGIDLVLEAGMDRIRSKSVQLTSYLVYLVDTVLAPLALRWARLAIRPAAALTSASAIQKATASTAR